jgi:hypothetical protein
MKMLPSNPTTQPVCSETKYKHLSEFGLTLTKVHPLCENEEFEEMKIKIKAKIIFANFGRYIVTPFLILKNIPDILQEGSY